MAWAVFPHRTPAASIRFVPRYGAHCASNLYCDEVLLAFSRALSVFSQDCIK